MNDQCTTQDTVAFRRHADATEARNFEWDASTYHRISDPQYGWGMRALSRLRLRGDEVVIDAGCGSGRLTAELLERLPRGRVIAVDRSQNMLDEARHTLARFGDRVSFLAADLQTFVAEEPVDVFFSTTALHWVLDQDHLYRNVFASVRPGGRLHAQIGGDGTLRRLQRDTRTLMHRPEYAPCFEGFTDPWDFAAADISAARIRRAGFVDVETATESVPIVYPSAPPMRLFIERVILRHHLERLPDDSARTAFLDTLTEMIAKDDPPYVLDYICLDLCARRPS
ncbi:methyltransferase domain-containing protein [Chondromyces crocatus]|uniref:Methyltransferase domain-containing protein n=1 Tax=Chondromyces crocatus TaxID=52 RepID=A0A0K1ENQ9_CHOCO|nr:methyltransferase domain-containing protein [Chondromyces crocatus]AKT42243.1 uncharacterized protein CMC5_064660 [Chondromyces crocatus]